MSITYVFLAVRADIMFKTGQGSLVTELGLQCSLVMLEPKCLSTGNQREFSFGKAVVSRVVRFDESEHSPTRTICT